MGNCNSLPLLSDLRDSCSSSSMNIENYRAVTLAFSARLPFAFDRWWAMGIIRGANSH